MAEVTKTKDVWIKLPRDTGEKTLRQIKRYLSQRDCQFKTVGEVVVAGWSRLSNRENNI